MTTERVLEIVHDNFSAICQEVVEQLLDREDAAERRQLFLQVAARYVEADETCCCGELIADHHQGGSCLSPKSQLAHSREFF